MRDERFFASALSQIIGRVTRGAKAHTYPRGWDNREARPIALTSADGVNDQPRLLMRIMHMPLTRFGQRSEQRIPVWQRARESLGARVVYRARAFEQMPLITRHNLQLAAVGGRVVGVTVVPARVKMLGRKRSGG